MIIKRKITNPAGRKSINQTYPCYCLQIIKKEAAFEQRGVTNVTHGAVIVLYRTGGFCCDGRGRGLIVKGVGGLRELITLRLNFSASTMFTLLLVNSFIFRISIYCCLIYRKLDYFENM